MQTLNIQLRNASPRSLAVITLEQAICDLRRRNIKDVAMFGLTTDGLPCLLHLRDPRPGAILVSSIPGYPPAGLLRTIALSALALTASLGIIVVNQTPWYIHDKRILQIRNDQLLPKIIPAIRARNALHKALIIVESPKLIGDWETFSKICRDGPLACIWPILVTENPGNIPAGLFRTHITCLQPETYMLHERKQNITFYPLYQTEDITYD